MKSETVSMRIEAADRRAFGKAAREHKNLSAFLLASARDAIRYRRLIGQIKKYEREGLITLGALNVREG
jgi:hypothetical protein